MLPRPCWEHPNDGRNDVLALDAGQPQSSPPGPPTGNNVPGWLLVYLNRGVDGSGNPVFSREIMPVGQRPLGMGLADFNGDGNVDMGIDNENTDAVQMLLGDGNGNFALVQTVDVGSHPFCDSPHFPAADDFTGDGIPDLLVPCNNNGPILMFRGTGEGTMSAPTVIDAGRANNFGVGGNKARPHTLALGDFDDSETVDFASANTGVAQPDPSISVFANRPWGTFVEAAGSPYQAGTDEGARTAYVRSAKMRGSMQASARNHPDLVVTSAAAGGPQRIAVLLGDRSSTGLFEHAPNSPFLVSPVGAETAPDQVREFTVGDLNGDDKTDVAVVLRSGKVAVLLHG
ncbi:MAG: hypothetical protein GEU83_08190 [Pseudonocardiaceae bacterium]|nr:hypothetical protein [Pseudonocardiaceae bacterium]